MYDPSAEHDACGVGFVVDMKGRRSHEIVRKALRVLINLEHRGACGCEANTGDGAGILVQVPDKFLRKVVPFTLPPAGAYGVGLVFLPRDESDREAIVAIVTRIVAEEGQTLLGWRDVPSDNSLLGDSAKATQPVFRHRVHRGAGCGRDRRDGVRAQALRHSETDRARGRCRRYQSAVPAILLHRQSLGADADLQGHADRPAAPADVPGSVGRRSRVVAGARASALQHEHVSVLAAGASLPLRRAQRRDQHAAREYQLDARARRAAAIRCLRR